MTAMLLASKSVTIWAFMQRKPSALRNISNWVDMSKTYVVFRGKTPGIYDSWKTVEEQVRGFSGADYKRYPSRHDAQRAWDQKRLSVVRPVDHVSKRKRSASDDGESLGIPAEGNIQRTLRHEIPDSDDEISSSDDWRPEVELHRSHRTEIPDSEDEDSSGDEAWQALLAHNLSTSFEEESPEPRVEEEPPDKISIVGEMMANFGYESDHGSSKEDRGTTKTPEIPVSPKDEIEFDEDDVPLSQLKGRLDLRAPQITLTAAQQAVVTMAENGDNIFLTGAAGSGKTAVLKEIISRLEKTHKTKNKKFPAVQVTAPTGIAALHLEGKTTWSFAGWNTNSFHQTRGEMLKDIKKQVIRTMRDTRALIIDEISMVENHFLERLNIFMQHILDSTLPFGGKQLIIVGDFHQLPPVKPFECCIECGEPMEPKLGGPVCTTSWCKVAKDPVSLKWGDKWAFKAPVWEKLKLKHVKLEQIHRQKDTRFQSTLNKIRHGTSLSDEEWKILEQRKPLPQGVVPVRLMSRVAQVRSFNNARLAALTTGPKVWAAHDVCRKESHKDSDNPRTVARKQQTYLATLQDHTFLTDLTLKVGAKVLLTYNLAPEHAMVNGSQGEVVGFVDTTRWTIKVPEGDNKKWREEQVKAFHRINPWRPVVRFANGYTSTIEPICAESVRGRSDDRYLVSRTQIPLTLGWALSIHKSQGMTLDYVELSSRDIFESGQLYVGLSRATKLEGLTVTGFSRNQLGMDPNVLAFYRDTKWVDLPSNRPD